LAGQLIWRSQSGLVGQDQIQNEAFNFCKGESRGSSGAIFGPIFGVLKSVLAAASVKAITAELLEGVSQCHSTGMQIKTMAVLVLATCCFFQ
jgi:hypothetical protein